MVAMHNLFWSLGLALMIISVGYSFRFIKDHGNKTKIHREARLMFIVGLILYFISFFLPIPIVY